LNIYSISEDCSHLSNFTFTHLIIILLIKYLLTKKRRTNYEKNLLYHNFNDRINCTN